MLIDYGNDGHAADTLQVLASVAGACECTLRVWVWLAHIKLFWAGWGTLSADVLHLHSLAVR